MSLTSSPLNADPISYNNAIREMAENRSSTTLFSSGSENAIIVLENILLQSKKVRMFAGNFNESVCNDNSKRFEKALKYFLLNLGEIHVILNEYNDENNNIINILRQYSASEIYRHNINVRVTNEKPVINNNQVHYTVGDESMYRLEYDTQNFHAQFCFKDIETSRKLIEKFTASYSFASPLELQPLMALSH